MLPFGRNLSPFDGRCLPSSLHKKQKIHVAGAWSKGKKMLYSLSIYILSLCLSFIVASFTFAALSNKSTQKFLSSEKSIRRIGYFGRFVESAGQAIMASALFALLAGDKNLTALLMTFGVSSAMIFIGAYATRKMDEKKEKK